MKNTKGRWWLFHKKLPYMLWRPPPPPLYVLLMCYLPHPPLWLYSTHYGMVEEVAGIALPTPHFQIVPYWTNTAFLLLVYGVLGICWAADPWHLFFGFQEVKFRTVSCWSGAPGKCKRTWLAREHNCCFAGTWGTPCHASAIWEQRRMRLAYLRSYRAICFQILPVKS